MADDLLARIEFLEQHIDWLYANAGVQGPYGSKYAQPAPQQAQTQQQANGDWPYPVSPTVMDVLRRGNLIAAVKQQRIESGMGLADAKDIVEQAQRMLR